MPIKSTQKIIYFDGYCALCSASVNWVIAKDAKGEFKFASLQGLFAEAHIPKSFNASESKTILYWDGQKMHSKSTAALYITKELPFAWKLLYVFIVIPRPVRDIVYDYISKNRFQWFGKFDNCRLPQPHEKHLFFP